MTKSTEEIKAHFVQIRATTKEKLKLQENAKKENLTVSQYILKQCAS